MTVCRHVPRRSPDYLILPTALPSTDNSSIIDSKAEPMNRTVGAR